MVYISNAFSLGMIESNSILKVTEVSLENVKKLLSSGFTSAIGHASTSDILTKMLGIEIQTNRISVKLEQEDILVVFQLQTRLEEGRVLTEAEISQLPTKFYLVEILPSETLEALYHW
jgi:hypothetical protein